MNVPIGRRQDRHRGARLQGRRLRRPPRGDGSPRRHSNCRRSGTRATRTRRPGCAPSSSVPPAREGGEAAAVPDPASTRRPRRPPSRPSRTSTPQRRPPRLRRPPRPRPDHRLPGGYASDMTGTKARYLEDWCHAATRLRPLRLSGTRTLRRAGLVDRHDRRVARRCLAILTVRTRGPLLLVGSSMGAGSCCLPRSRCGRASSALVGVAAAPIHRGPSLGSPRRGERATLAAGRRHPPPVRLRRAHALQLGLVEDGRQRLLLRSPLDVPGPVRLLHGTRDADVPWATSMRLAEAIRDRDVAVTLVKDGGDRLSEPTSSRCSARPSRACSDVAASPPEPGDPFGELIATSARGRSWCDRGASTMPRAGSCAAWCRATGRG